MCILNDIDPLPPKCPIRLSRFALFVKYYALCTVYHAFVNKIVHSMYATPHFVRIAFVLRSLASGILTYAGILVLTTSLIFLWSGNLVLSGEVAPAWSSQLRLNVMTPAKPSDLIHFAFASTLSTSS